MKKRVILSVLFAAYAAFMIWLLFIMRSERLFLAPDGYWTAFRENINMIPFRTIADYAQKLVSTKANGDAVINLFGNVIMFVPLGFFIPAVFPKERSFRKSMLWTLAVLVCIEVIQLVTLLGSFDIDDVILNMAGAAVGYGVYKIITVFSPKNNSV